MISRLHEIVERLGQITAELEAGEADGTRVAELAREASELAAEAVEETNRLMREAESSAE